MAHSAAVVPLATFSKCIDRSAGRLLGRESRGPGFYWSSPAHGFSGFAECPGLAPEAFDEARKAFANRGGERHRRLAPIIGRLAEALARSGPYSAEDRVLDVAIALERMFKLEARSISLQLQEKVADFLEGDNESKHQVRAAVKHFYEVRSAIIHGPSDEKKRSLLEEKNKAFRAGFDLARKALFKKL